MSYRKEDVNSSNTTDTHSHLLFTKRRLDGAVPLMPTEAATREYTALMDSWSWKTPPTITHRRNWRRKINSSTSTYPNLSKLLNRHRTLTVDHYAENRLRWFDGFKILMLISVTRSSALCSANLNKIVTLLQLNSYSIYILSNVLS